MQKVPQRGKRTYSSRKQAILTTREIVQTRGESPINHLIRLAYKAENEGDLNLASSNWKEIQAYLEPKMKAIDPIEQNEKRKQTATLAQLADIRTAILKGDVTTLPEESKVIDVQPIEQRGIMDML